MHQQGPAPLALAESRGFAEREAGGRDAASFEGGDFVAVALFLALMLFLVWAALQLDLD